MSKPGADSDIGAIEDARGIVIGGRFFYPGKCIADDHPDGPHYCVHDWRIHWGNYGKAEAL